MMLPAGMPPGALSRCAQLRMGAVLNKPVEKGELMAAVQAALRGPVAEKPRESAPVMQPGLTPRLRILLAEDNPINRALAAGLIEKRGHVLLQVTNGQEAVIAARDESIDLILMDVQMPEMDGFEATRRIREEQQQGGRRVPIIAITAHAMTGDRERCLAEGMDDYISKPIRKEELMKIIDRVVAERPLRVVPAPGAVVAKVMPEPQPAQEASMYSREELRERFDGDDEIIGRVAVLFRQDTPRLLNAARNSIELRSPEQLARTAHTLLSSYGVLGAMGAWELAHRLELEAKGENYSDLQQTFKSLEQETDRIQAALAKISPLQCG
jgi:two-component system sensor histidine kinase/response regulator